MGLMHGSMNVSRYKVLGSKKTYKLKDLGENFLPFQAKKIALQGAHQAEKALWARPSLDDSREYVDPSGHWDLSDCQCEDGFVLRMQLEKRKVPSNLLQLTIKERLFKKSEKRVRPITPQERKALRAEVKSELLGLALPDLTYVDAFWRPETHDLLVFTTAKNMLKHFEFLFQKSFTKPLALTLLKVNPPLLSLAQEEWQDEVLASKKLEKLSLTTPTKIA